MQVVVTNAFGPYERGDVIDDPKIIQELRASQNAANIVLSAAPEPAPAAVPDYAPATDKPR